MQLEAQESTRHWLMKDQGIQGLTDPTASIEGLYGLTIEKQAIFRITTCCRFANLSKYLSDVQVDNNNALFVLGDMLCQDVADLRNCISRI